VRGDARSSGVRLVAFVLTLLLAAGPLPPVAAELHSLNHHPDAPVESQTPPSMAAAGVSGD